MSTPLIAIVSVIYLCVAVSLSFDGKQGLALFYAGCALANTGLIWEAMR